MGLNARSKSDLSGFDDTNFDEVFHFKRIKKIINKNIIWRLPCSKSHFIRWLFISAQTSEETKIIFTSKIGKDILSCANVLEKLGVEIKKKKNYWKIVGCEKGNFNMNPGVLDCGNSATTLRFLTFLLVRNGINAKVVGDKSLSKRNFSQLIKILEEGGVAVKHEYMRGFLPFSVNGKFNLNLIDVSVKKTSQLLSGLIITMPSINGENKLLIKGKMVSKPYFELTLQICKETGAIIDYNEEIIELNSWVPKINNDVIIFGEASLVIFPILFCKLHNIDVLVENWSQIDENLGFELLGNYLPNFGLNWNIGENKIMINNFGNDSFVSIDINNNIDLITPLSILMSLSGGGSLKGISHAKNKESNRIETTIKLFEKFGLKLNLSEELLISKSQLSVPEKTINAYGDHRLQMSAFILLSFTGGASESNPWYENSDPEFIERLQSYGVSIS
ncbi:MAG: hypothetical protein CMB48_01265 [Euryarchaeota archaeon]|nr:hypothetical protein [Euryarchaeota archaeon]|tara:strand:+ start:924 stop:2267 length:1344 start_codon:yes stop_codon:yes gene_type:complete